MTCQDCTKAEASRFSGTYTLTCLMCCVRLVVSARPMGKSHQEAMLTVIARTQGAPSRQQVLECLRQHYPVNPKPSSTERIQKLKAAIGR